MRRDPARPLRGARRLRRAVHPVRQRRRRSASTPCSPASATSARRSATSATSSPRPGARTCRRRTSSPATGATSAGCSPATRTSRRTCRSRAVRRSCARALERTAQARISAPLGRQLQVFRQQGDSVESEMLADQFRVTDADVRAGAGEPRGERRAVRTPHGQLVPPGHRQPVLRRVQHGASHRGPPRAHARRREPLRRVVGTERAVLPLRAALRRSPRSRARRSCSTTRHVPRSSHCRSATSRSRRSGPPRTPWRSSRTRGGGRYLIQDFEPMFYPAGTLYALAEESYRLGLYGLCNTEHMLPHLRGPLRREGRVLHARARHERVLRRRQP